MHSEQSCPQLTSVVPCRHESDTTDLYCIFDPDTAHRLAGWGRDWHENHRLGQADFEVRSLQCQCFSRKSPKLGKGGGLSTCVLQAEEDVLDRIIPGLTVLLRQAGMRCHPAHPLLAPLRAIAHLRQVFVQNASLRIDSYGDQWLRTIPPAASRLLQSTAGKQLRQETWDKHVAAEAVLSDRNLLFTNPTVSAAAPRCCRRTCFALNLCPSVPQAFFFKTLGGKEAPPMPFAPVVMLPQVPLSGVQPPASAKHTPWVPLASQASCGITLPPQSLSALSALDKRDSFLFEKQVCSQSPSSLSACVLVRL